MKKITITAGCALAALVLAACGTSRPAPAKLSAACSTAVDVVHYIQGTNGTNDIQNDQVAAYSLHTAHWATAAQRRYAAALSLGLDTAGTASAGNAVTLIPAARGLLKACATR